MPRRGEVTILLESLSGGQRDAESRLFALLYDDLRAVAAAEMRREFRGERTLQVTALVHEAFIRLAGDNVPWQSRRHFFGIVARVMRRILVEHGREIGAQRRGGDAIKVSLDEAVHVPQPDGHSIVELDEALTRLTAFDARQARVVELKVFAGLTIEEIADVLDLSTRQINRDWRMARAWLSLALSEGDSV